MIVQKYTTSGAKFIPVHPHLSRCCKAFYARQDEDYTLAELWLVITLNSSFSGIQTSNFRTTILNYLIHQLTVEAFATSNEGKFVYLVTLVKTQVLVPRRGKEIVSKEDKDGELTPAILEAMFPYRSCDFPGNWILILAIPSFGWEMLSVVGTIPDLAKLLPCDTAWA